MAVALQPTVPMYSAAACPAGSSTPAPAPLRMPSHAAAHQAAGAGEVFWSQAVDRLDLAVVLEPEVDEACALQVHFVLMVACGDAVGAIGPPELALQYRWPTAILANGAQVGTSTAGASGCRRHRGCAGVDGGRRGDGDARRAGPARARPRFRSRRRCGMRAAPTWTRSASLNRYRGTSWPGSTFGRTTASRRCTKHGWRAARSAAASSPSIMPDSVIRDASSVSMKTATCCCSWSQVTSTLDFAAAVERFGSAA
jgi:hypothetical protein